MSWFSKGYTKVKEVSKRIEEALSQEYIPSFFLKDGEEATVRFLTDEPLTFYEHFVKGINKSFTCPQTPDCPLCAIGNKPSFRGAYLIIDQRSESWEDKQTREQKSRVNTVKALKMGIRALQVLDRKNAKKGLLNHDWVVSRTGQGNNTIYDFEDVQRVAGITLPEKLPNLEESLKPRDREYLLQQLAQAGKGTPSYQNPIENLGDEDEGVINFR